ncbi:glutathione-dependent formaldehyde-activating enzyme [Seiridium cupressi]
MQRLRILSLFSIGIFLIAVSIIRILEGRNSHSQGAQTLWASLEIICAAGVAVTPSIYALARNRSENSTIVATLPLPVGYGSHTMTSRIVKDDQQGDRPCPTLARYFCTTCGCQVLGRWGDEATWKEEDIAWMATTGVVSERLDTASNTGYKNGERADLEYMKHCNLESTKDGGLALWIDEVAGRRLKLYSNLGTGPEGFDPVGPASDRGAVLPASCRCGTVKFHITPPDAGSREPRSNFPDLIIPYHTQSPEIKNPNDVKWWLRPVNIDSPTKYLAGTCACRTCRLTCGYEIQTWAFVPRHNIVFHIPNDEAAERGSGAKEADRLMPLNFSTLPAGAMKCYNSSPGVVREFCAKCGATVFWHDQDRPELIDVSVGILDAPEGARAENWLDWWTERVSFSEEAGSGRSGIVKVRAESLIENLGKGMRKSRQNPLSQGPRSTS